MAAVVTSSSTPSIAERSGGAADDAKAKSTMAVVPSSRSSTFSARRLPCAMRAACNR
jgi:hypothetical protein